MWTASARAQYRRSGRRYATDVSDAEFALIGVRLATRLPRCPCCLRLMQLEDIDTHADL